MRYVTLFPFYEQENQILEFHGFALDDTGGNDRTRSYQGHLFPNLAIFKIESLMCKFWEQNLG